VQQISLENNFSEHNADGGYSADADKNSMGNRIKYLLCSQNNLFFVF